MYYGEILQNSPKKILSEFEDGEFRGPAPFPTASERSLAHWEVKIACARLLRISDDFFVTP